MGIGSNSYYHHNEYVLMNIYQDDMDYKYNGLTVYIEIDHKKKLKVR